MSSVADSGEGRGLGSLIVLLAIMLALKVDNLPTIGAETRALVVASGVEAGAMAADAKAEWVARVLGVRVGGSSPTGAGFDEAGFRRAFAAALQRWRDASEKVDAQIGALRNALLATDDADLHRIADTGLNGITGRRKVGLQTALGELAGASGPKLVPLARKAAEAAQEYQSFVQSDPRVHACDAYPKITTPIGATLGPALGDLARALSI